MPSVDTHVPIKYPKFSACKCKSERHSTHLRGFSWGNCFYVYCSSCKKEGQPGRTPEIAVQYWEALQLIS